MLTEDQPGRVLPKGLFPSRSTGPVRPAETTETRWASTSARFRASSMTPWVRSTRVAAGVRGETGSSA